MRRFNNFLFIAAMMFTAQPLLAQKVNQFSAKQAVDYAMKNATAVSNALLDIQAQKQNNRDLLSAAYPQIQSSVQFNDFTQLPTSLIPAEFNGGTPGTYFPIQFGTTYNLTGSIDFSQLLFDGQVFVGLQARAAVIDFYTKQAEVTQEMIKVNVYKVYYQLVVGKKQMGSIDANIERFEKLLSDTRQIYKNGFVEKLDVDKVSVQLNNLKTEKIKVQSQLDAGNAALKFLMNMPQAETLMLTDSVTESDLVNAVDTGSVDYKNRKEYQMLEVGLKLARYNVKRFQLSAYPTIALIASYNQNAQRNKFNFLQQGSWYPTSLIGLRMQMPIFNGMARQSKLEKARIELRKTQNNFNQLKESIDNEVAQSSFRIDASLVTVESQKKNMNLAEQVYTATKLKYEQGLGSQQEIYNAQTELKMAQNNYYGAMYDAVVAIIDHRKATGKL